MTNHGAVFLFGSDLRVDWVSDVLVGYLEGNHQFFANKAED